MRYSNSWYVLLGALIEHLTGQTLDAFLQQNIFSPLGMTRTGTDTTAIRPGHALGYYADGSQPAAYPISAFFADGGLYSTVADLQRWDAAVQDSTLISAALTAQTLTVHAAWPPAGKPRRLPDRCRPRVRLRVVRRPHPLRAAVPARGPDHGWVSFNGIYPRQHEHVIILASSEATRVLDICTTLAAI